MIPYLIGYALTPPDMQFSWVIPVTDIDVHPWLSEVRQAQEGRFLIQHQYWIEPHPSALHPFWVSVGLISGVLGLSPIGGYHLARMIVGFILLISIYRLIALFEQDIFVRRSAFFFLILSSGFGWLKALGINMSSIDLWMPEAITFYSIYGFPHISFSILLMVLILYYTLLAFRERKRKYIIYSGVSAFFLGLVHPFDLIPIYAAITVCLAEEWRRERRFPLEEVKSFISILIFSIISLAYIIYLYVLSPTSSIMTKEMQFSFPNSIWYVTGYGIIFILASIGAIKIAKAQRTAYYPILAWAIMALILVYIPLRLPHQRRFMEGAHIPLSMVATVGISQLLTELREWWNRKLALRKDKQRSYHFFGNKEGFRRVEIIFIVLLIAFSSLTNVYIITSDVQAYRGFNFEEYVRDPEGGVPRYIPDGIILAMEWLAKNTDPEGVVLSSVRMGDLIPAWAPHRVYLGRWYSVPDLKSKYSDVMTFFKVNIPDSLRNDFLKRYSIKYIFYGPVERALGDFNPDREGYLVKIYDNGLVSIHEVK